MCVTSGPQMRAVTDRLPAVCVDPRSRGGPPAMAKPKLFIS